TETQLAKPVRDWTGTGEQWRKLSGDARRVMHEEERKRRGLLLTEIAASSRDPAVVDGLSFVAALILLMLLAGTIGASASDLARLEQDVEWMLSLPVSTTAIYAAKAVERTLMNLMGWFSVGPFVTIVALHWGAGWWSPVWGVGAALIVNGVVSCLAIGIELASHRLLRASGRRNLQAAAGLAQIVFMLGCMAYGTQAGSSFSWLSAAAKFGGPAARWLPGGLVLGAIHGGPGTSLSLAALAAWTLGAAALAAAATAWASRRGLEAVQADAGRRGVPRATGESGEMFGGILGKELRLLLRDRVLLMQIALLPVVVAASQVALNPGFFKRALASPLLSGAVAFGLGAYTLMSAAPGVLFHEKDALWLLYTFPRQIGSVVLRKVLLWTAIAAGWALSAAAFTMWKRGGPGVGDVPGLAWIVFGLPVYALMAASLGVLGFDPTATDMSRRLRVDLQYLVMLLGAMLGGGLYRPGAAPRVAVLVVFAAVAACLWQKAAARFETLLDPAIDPPRQLDAADGLVAVAIFLYAQTGLITAMVMGAELEAVAAFAVAAPFAAAGAIGLVLLVLWRTGLPLAELPGFWPQRPARSFGLALAAGLAAAAVAVGWQFLPIARPPTPGPVFALITLATAPFLQEFLFRGLVFQPLRKFLPFFPAALGSALVFAIVQPPFGMVPALALGVAAAWVQERSKGLLAPMVCHGVCAGAMVGVAWLR
ncbi:MAG: CPBP family intramembrane metalloprotease, partial [Planctomycetes bacterium]|nr:CPBP family intramembrane metalloprotease [Planctomycetota bacterium]